MHGLHLHLGPGKGLLDGPVLVLLQALHLLQHLPVRPFQLRLVHGDLVAKAREQLNTGLGKEGAGVATALRRPSTNVAHNRGTGPTGAGSLVAVTLTTALPESVCAGL